MHCAHQLLPKQYRSQSLCRQINFKRGSIRTGGPPDDGGHADGAQAREQGDPFGNGLMKFVERGSGLWIHPDARAAWNAAAGLYLAKGCKILENYYNSRRLLFPA